MVRVGLPTTSPVFADRCRWLKAPVMISANALRRRGRFRPPRNLELLDVALDSAGFVAMLRYGGFPWSISDYVALAGSFEWAWWASMDYCCEPEVAADRDEVRRRQDETFRLLGECRTEADRQGVQPPMPVLQGWTPDDYERAVEQLGPVGLVGVGSMCRRHVSGVLPIIDRLDRCLPRDVTLHLFGVKGPAMTALRGHHRIVSVDSMAWDMACRREADNQRTTTRADWLEAWYRRQLRNLALPGWALQMEMAF